MNRREFFRSIIPLSLTTAIWFFDFDRSQEGELQEFWSNDVPNGSISVFLNGKNISEECMKFFGIDIPGVEVYGSADLIELPLRICPNGEINTNRVYGNIKWEFIE
jgi:hypothetical protein